MYSRDKKVHLRDAVLAAGVLAAGFVVAAPGTVVTVPAGFVVAVPAGAVVDVPTGEVVTVPGTVVLLAAQVAAVTLFNTQAHVRG